MFLFWNSFAVRWKPNRTPLFLCCWSRRTDFSATGCLNNDSSSVLSSSLPVRNTYVRVFCGKSCNVSNSASTSDISSESTPTRINLIIDRADLTQMKINRIYRFLRTLLFFRFFNKNVKFRWRQTSSLLHPNIWRHHEDVEVHFQ